MKNKNGQRISQTTNAEALTRTPEAFPSMDAIHNDIIPEKGESVKGSSEKISTDKDAKGPKTIAEIVEEGKSRQREAAIEKFAEENVKDYAELSDVAKRAVRTTIRQARALGINEAAIKHAANVAARSGVNVLFDKEALKLAGADKYSDGAYLNGNIYINPELSEGRTVDMALMHELGHMMMDLSGRHANIHKGLFGFLVVSDKKMKKINIAMQKEAWEHTTDETKRQIAERYGISKVNLDKMAENRAVLRDEIWAHFAEKLYGDAGVWEYFLGEDKSISKAAVAYWYEAARDYMGDETMARHARAFARKFKKMFEQIAEKNTGMNGAAMMGARVGDDDKEIKRALTIELGDVKIIRIIAAAHGGERVSVNDFTSEDIQKAEKWARKFYSELGTKSPFFRAWFGDWRTHDTTKINTVTVDTIDIADAVMQSGNYEINDTGWTVHAGRTLNKETAHYAGREKVSVKALTAVKDILKNAVLLDTEVSNPDSKNKSPNTAFMHKLYAPFIYDGQTFIAKITVEEFYNEETKNADRKAYHLQGIKIESAGGRFAVNTVLTPMPGTDSINSISDLFELVKTYDKEFHPKEVNAALLNEDGTPKVVYHTKAVLSIKKQSEYLVDVTQGSIPVRPTSV